MICRSLLISLSSFYISRTRLHSLYSALKLEASMGSTSTPSRLSRSLGDIYVAFCSKEPENGTGNFSNWISRFDPSESTWSHVSTIPGILQDHVLKDFAMTYVGGSIYVIGGRLCQKVRSTYNNGFSEIEVQVLPTVLRYNIISDQWSNCASLGLQRYNFACTVCDNKIYVAGGLYEKGNARSTSQVEVFDPLTNTWTNLSDMKRFRYNCAGVTWQNKFHVVGGFIKGCDPSQTIACVERCSAEVYNAQEGKWDLIPGMWQLDVPPNQIVSVEDRLFSCGDCLNARKGHIEVYDGKLNLWNVVEGPHRTFDFGNMKRVYVTMAPIGPCLYFVAGFKVFGEEPGNVLVVCRFDTTARENPWTCFEPLREEEEKELCAHCCVAPRS